MLEVHSHSREYVRVAVAATEDGTAVNPTTDTVEMAFTDGATPSGADWKTAEWETSGSTYYARCLVGPGGTVQLAEGRYVVFVKVTDNPEIPLLNAGLMEVT